MEIVKCTVDDAAKLAVLNRQLIEDERSDNKMDIDELTERMTGFLKGDYKAYLFTENGDTVGYALVNFAVSPLYLRQFLIDRKYRRRHMGQKAFALLMDELKTDSIDLEVLSWNEPGMMFWTKCGFTERSRYMRLTK